MARERIESDDERERARKSNCKKSSWCSKSQQATTSGYKCTAGSTEEELLVRENEIINLKLFYFICKVLHLSVEQRK